MRKYSEEYWAEREQRGRCTAHNKDGSRHKQPAIAGSTVCYRHGGAAPQVKAAANRRLAQQTALQWAQQELDRVGVSERTPLEHLEASLERAAQNFALWDLACRSLLGDSYGTGAEEGSLASQLVGRDRHGQLAIHPYVQERDQALQQWARISKYALDAGVSQRRVQIEQERANLIAVALRSTLAALGLTPELQQQGLTLLGERLRALPSA